MKTPAHPAHSPERTGPPADFIYNPPDEPLRIIYSDDHIIVLDKPSRLLTVPGKADNHKDCLEARVQVEFEDATIVHRLDMDTSGLLIMARNRAAHRHLGLQFERRHVEKIYLADVDGVVSEDEGVIDLPLRCDWPNRPRQMVDHEFGRNALTEWQVLARGSASTRVEMKPKTGRSHQLRVHMLALGHPILGDNLYATGKTLEASDRLALHAHRLSVFHPIGGERYLFESPCPF